MTSTHPMGHTPAQHSELSLEDETLALGWVSLAGVSAMVFVLLTTYAFRKRRTRWLPDSSIAMLIGMLVGLLLLMLETRIQASTPLATTPGAPSLSLMGSTSASIAPSAATLATANGLATSTTPTSSAATQAVSPTTRAAPSALLTFSPKLFFFLLLPPIILDAGYSLKGRHFFQNMTPSLLLAGPGVLLSTVLVGLGAYFASRAHWFGHLAAGPFGLLESLMFGALLSVTDSVATISVLGSPDLNISQRLYSIVFGESVLNDAIGILVFDTLARHAREIPVLAVATSATATASSTSALVASLVASFFKVLIASVLLGATVALGCSYLFRKLGLQDFPHFEFILVLMFAYSSYVLALVLQLSGVVSIFVCGAMLARYNWYNLSLPTRTSTKFGFKAFSTFAELLVFLYLGLSFALSLGPSLHTRWSPSACLVVLGLVLVSRALVVFPLLSLWNCASSTKTPLTLPMQVILFCGGLRGAISLALALNMHGPHYHLMVTTTLFIVATTSLLGGACTDRVVRQMDQLIKQDRKRNAMVTDDSEEEMAVGGNYHRKRRHSAGQDDDGVFSPDRQDEPTEDDEDNDEEHDDEDSHLIARPHRASHMQRNPFQKMTLMSFLMSSTFWLRLEANIMQPLFGGPNIASSDAATHNDPSVSKKPLEQIIETD